MEWFRFYHEALDDPKVQRLPGELFKAWVNLLCLANQGSPRGRLPSIEDIAFRLRVSEDEARRIIASLRAHGLFEVEDGQLEPHNWDNRQRKSDDVAARVAKHRGNKPTPEPVTEDPVTRNVTGNANVTVAREEQIQSRTDTEQNREVAAAAPPRPSRSEKQIPRDELTRAVGRAWMPGVPWEQLTKTQQSTCARCSAQLYPIGITVEQVEQSRRTWDTDPKWQRDGRPLTFTPDALLKFVQDLVGLTTPTANGAGNAEDRKRRQAAEQAEFERHLAEAGIESPPPRPYGPAPGPHYLSPVPRADRRGG